MDQQFSLFIFSLIFGVFCAATARIVFYHYIVLTTIRLATSQQIFDLHRSNNHFAMNFRLAKRTNATILFFWYPFSLITGYCNVSLLIMFINSSLQHYTVPFYLKAISIIGTATVVVHSLLTSIVRSPLFIWNIDLQIMSIEHNIKQFNDKISDVSSDPLLSNFDRESLINDLSLRVNRLIKKKNSLLYIKQHINKV